MQTIIRLVLHYSSRYCGVVGLETKHMQRADPEIKLLSLHALGTRQVTLVIPTTNHVQVRIVKNNNFLVLVN